VAGVIGLGFLWLGLPGAARAASRPDPGALKVRVDRTSRLVRRLRDERERLRADLQRYRYELDDTRAMMAEMDLRLSGAEGQYEQTFATYAASLEGMYKVHDQLYWAAIVEGFDPDTLSTEYDLYSRVAADERRVMEQMEEQRRLIDALQQGIADLKAARLAREAQIQARLDVIDGVLASKQVELAEARKDLREALPTPPPSPSVPPAAGLNGVLAAASHPPRGYGPSGETFAGYASWYGGALQGNHTANGEIYNMYAFTCASRTLPFNTWLRVTWQGRAVFVRVNDRGPMAPERVLDLSFATAGALGMVSTGVAWVEAEIWRR